MRDHENWMISGLQNNVCYDCLKPFCSGCSIDENEDGDGILDYCGHCEKDYCQNCIPIIECAGRRHGKKCKRCGDMKACDECGNTVCKDCMYNTCSGCKRTVCDDCNDHSETFLRCHESSCYKMHCADCYDGKEYSVKRCDDCWMSYCSADCKLRHWGTIQRIRAVLV